MIKEFLKYYFGYFFNYLWTASTVGFIIGLCLKGAPVFYILALIPFLLLVFNVLTEYNAFRKQQIFNVQKLRIGTFLACLAIIVTIVIIMLF